MLVEYTLLPVPNATVWAMLSARWLEIRQDLTNGSSPSTTGCSGTACVHVTPPSKLAVASQFSVR